MADAEEGPSARLPDATTQSSTGCSSADSICSSSSSSSSSQYLCYFLHRHLDFRRPEVESLAQLAGCLPDAICWSPPAGGLAESPFWHLRLPGGDATVKAIAARSLLVKSFVELWAEGESWADIRAGVEAFPLHRKRHFLGPDQTFKVVVDGWGRCIQLEEQLEMISRLAFIPFQGRVRLDGPDNTFLLVVARRQQNNGLPEVPDRMYFGRVVAGSDRRVIERYKLTRRLYVGPTSMDAEMAFLMANQAQVRRGSFVYDPFVGTGSILVAAAHLGAVVLGSDIDAKVVRDGGLSTGNSRASGEEYDVRANFHDYGLPEPAGLLRSDAHRPPFRSGLEGVLDAVVTDPPYGVRAGGRRSVANPAVAPPIAEDHCPSMRRYGLSDLLRDLLDHSARLLRLGGRLVFFLPSAPELYKEEDLPSHAALTRVANSEQILSSRYSRRLITMVKTAPYDAEAARQHHEATADVGLLIDKVTELVFECRKGSRNGVAGQPDRNVNKKKFRGKLC